MYSILNIPEIRIFHMGKDHVNGLEIAICTFSVQPDVTYKTCVWDGDLQSLFCEYLMLMYLRKTYLFVAYCQYRSATCNNRMPQFR